MSFQTDLGNDKYARPASTGTTPSIPAARSGTATLTPPVSGALTTGTGPLWQTHSGEQQPVSIRARTPEPRLRQLIGVCGWAAVLGGVGLIIALRGIFGSIAGDPPSWYEPSVVVVGLTGVGFTVAAFLSVQRKRLPWALLSVSSVFFIVAMVLTASAF